MSRRLLVAAAVALLGMLGLTRTASAQDATMDRTTAPVLFTAANTATLANAPAAVAPQIPFNILHGRPASTSSMTLTSLYASTALMQALDVHSSLKAFRAGAVEGNPLMSGVVSNKTAFIAVKALVASSTIMAARQIGRRHKVAAAIMLAAINGTYAWVASHNYKLAHDLAAGR
jgi:hypothetical protein